MTLVLHSHWFGGLVDLRVVTVRQWINDRGLLGIKSSPDPSQLVTALPGSQSQLVTALPGSQSQLVTALPGSQSQLVTALPGSLPGYTVYRGLCNSTAWFTVYHVLCNSIVWSTICHVLFWRTFFFFFLLFCLKSFHTSDTRLLLQLSC